MTEQEEEQESQEIDLMHIVKQKCKQFGFEYEELPQPKQEQLKQSMQGIADSQDTKKGAAKELKKQMNRR